MRTNWIGWKKIHVLRFFYCSPMFILPIWCAFSTHCTKSWEDDTSKDAVGPDMHIHFEQILKKEVRKFMENLKIPRMSWTFAPWTSYINRKLWVSLVFCKRLSENCWNFIKFSNFPIQFVDKYWKSSYAARDSLLYIYLLFLIFPQLVRKFF